MATDIILPNAGFDTQIARILEWLVKPGDVVNKGDVIALIESDKANVELESLAAGTVLELLYAADTDVPIGATIARIGSAAEAPIPQAAAPAASRDRRISPLARRVASENQIDPAGIAGSGHRGKITRDDVERHLKSANGQGGILALPKVRRAARQAGIALAQVTPTGNAGQITLADLEAHRQHTQVQPQAARAGVVEVPLSRMRQTIASRLQKSAQEAPHFYVTGEFDLEAALRHLQTPPEPRPRVNDLIQYLTVRALMRVPQLNATFEDGYLYLSPLHL